MEQTAKNTIWGPLAAYYLVHGTSFISSHEDSPLPLHKFLDLFSSNHIEREEQLARENNGSYKKILWKKTICSGLLTSIQFHCIVLLKNTG